jgi:hypothetical protein
MTVMDIIGATTAGLATLAALAGFAVEWRRINTDRERIAELEAHVDNLESRVSAAEARQDRINRAM